MPTLSIGDRVSDLQGAHEGKLIDIEGATAYVMQTNGVEIEFPLARLKPYAPPKPTVHRTLSGPHRDTTISPEHAALLAAVPREILAAIAQSYASGAEPSRPRFESLPPSKQLDVLRIHLPTLPHRLIAPHMKLVLAVRDLAKASAKAAPRR